MGKNLSLFDRLKEESTPTKVSMITNVVLYLLVSVVSMFHAYKFFLEATSKENAILAIFTTIAFEIGQVASLFALNTLNKSNKGLIWTLFLFLTFVQVISNIGYGYLNISLDTDIYFKSLTDFFSFSSVIKPYLKHAFTIIYSGSLPVIALLFIKSLINYIAPATEDNFLSSSEKPKETKKEEKTDVNFLFGEADNNISDEIKKDSKIDIIPEIESPNNNLDQISNYPQVEEENIEKIEILQDDNPDKSEQIIVENKEPKKEPKKETVHIKVPDNDHTYQDINKTKMTVF